MKKKKKYRIKKKAILVLVIIILFNIIGISYGKYIYLSTRNFYLSSKKFYFNSDKLSETTSNFGLNNWSGVDDFPITFNMNSYKNNKVFSDADISYDIEFSCSDNVICTSNKQSDVISSTQHTSSFTINIHPNVSFNVGDIVWLDVSAKATAPYTKTLRGRITIEIGQMRLDYAIDDVANRTFFDVSVTNTRDYYRLIDSVSNSSMDHEITIDEYLNLSSVDKDKYASAIITMTFDPSVVILDMTTPAFSKNVGITYQNIGGYSYINSISFKMDALSSDSVRFYKIDISNNYTYPFINDNPIVSVSYT